MIVNSIVKALKVFGGSGIAPSFDPSAIAEHLEGLFLLKKMI